MEMRLGHLISMYVDRWEWTFGSRSIDPEVATDFTPSADKALAMAEPPGLIR